MNIFFDAGESITSRSLTTLGCLHFFKMAISRFNLPYHQPPRLILLVRLERELTLHLPNSTAAAAPDRRRGSPSSCA